MNHKNSKLLFHAIASAYEAAEKRREDKRDSPKDVVIKGFSISMVSNAFGIEVGFNVLRTSQSASIWCYSQFEHTRDAADHFLVYPYVLNALLNPQGPTYGSY